jgi:PAS domain S-box-containing protein
VERAGGFARGTVFEAALDAVIVMDGRGHVRDWNPAAERVFGFSRDEAIGRELAELIVPGPLRPAHRNALARNVETGKSSILDRRIELSALRRDGSEFAVELSVTRVAGADPPEFVGFVRELSERGGRGAENARIQERMAFLAQAGLVLDRSLDFQETVRGLADLTVPELAQLTVIDLLDKDDMIRVAVAAAAEPAAARAVEAMRREHPLSAHGAHPVAGVLRTCRSILLPVMEASFQREIAEGTEHYELMRSLRYQSAIVVPLVARRHVLGTMSLLRMEDAAPFDRDDLVLAEDLARRAALAVDNARMFESTRRLARTLQASLLPRGFPEIPGVRIAGGYRAAAQGQEVGGDFYDAFPVAPNRWGIAIGDVCGKGAEAAALTARTRYTIRALADRDAAGVLRQLNESVMRDRELLADPLLSVVFAAASIRDGGVALEVAAAGHPRPLVLRAGGEVEPVAVSGVLVGVNPEARYQAVDVWLGEGDTLVLYTDGLTDAHAPRRMLSEADVIELVERGRGMSAVALAQFLETSAAGDAAARDDIALLVMAVDR